jgi:hypothetical protein
MFENMPWRVRSASGGVGDVGKYSRGENFVPRTIEPDQHSARRIPDHPAIASDEGGGALLILIYAVFALTLYVVPPAPQGPG